MTATIMRSRAAAAAALVLFSSLTGWAWQAAAAAPRAAPGLAGDWQGVGLMQDSSVRVPSLIDLELKAQPDGTLHAIDRTRPGTTEYPVVVDGRHFNVDMPLPVGSNRSTPMTVSGTLSPGGKTLDVVVSAVGLSGKVDDVRSATLQRDNPAARAFFHARVDASGNPVSSYTYRAPVDPTGTYEIVTPEAAGFDRGKLEAMIDAILAQKFQSRTESVLVLRDGKLVLAEYFWGNGPGDGHQTWSALKSLTSVAAGIAWDQGAFKLDSTLQSYFPDRANTLWARENLAISVRQVLSMDTGAAIPEPQLMTTSPDMVAFMMNEPLEHPPAQHYAYDNGLPILTGQLVARTTGQAFDKFVDDKLFAPLGIKNVHWTYLADGSPNAAGGFFMTPLDMSRVGQMMLDKGMWRGKRIVSEAWVDQSTQQQTSKGDYPYGFYWHLNSESQGHFKGAQGFLALGALGQLIAVLPKERIVVVVTSTNTRPTDLLEKYIVPALATSGSPN